MKTRYQILALLLVFATVSCDKDSKQTNVVTPISGWEDTQKVRILKVEQQKRLFTFPYFADSVYYVEYQYNEEGNVIGFSTNHSFTKLGFPSNVSTEIHKVNISANSINFDFSFNTTMSIISRAIKTSQFLVENNRVTKVENSYGMSLYGEGPIPFERISDLSYLPNGLLKSIKSNISGVFALGKQNGTDINILEYNGNEIKNYQVKSILSRDENIKEVENYTVNLSYEKADDIPDALRRMVNQAILGLTTSGSEECYVNPLIYSDLSGIFGDLQIVAENNVFSDWIISFASSSIQTIPSQKTGIISSKQIIGKRIKDANLSEFGKDITTFEVDSTANFPYIHDASAKTLEIAGLKIYYELVE